MPPLHKRLHKLAAKSLNGGIDQHDLRIAEHDSEI